MSDPVKELRKALKKRDNARETAADATMAVWEQRAKIQSQQKRLAALRVAEHVALRGLEDADKDVLAKAEEVAR